MKKYIILCKEVTGISGKILTNGNTYDAFEFVPGCADELVKSGHIAEVKEETKTPAPKQTKDQTIDETTVKP